MARLDGRRALQMSRVFALIRVVVGLGSLLVPRAAGRILLTGAPRADGSVVPVRMFAGRELAMGLGTLLAARRGPSAVRGWVEAGGLADGVDAAAFLLDLTRSPGRRTARRPTAVATALTAGTAAATAPLLARALTGSATAADVHSAGVTGRQSAPDTSESAPRLPAASPDPRA